jgi:hypothetical protein
LTASTVLLATDIAAIDAAGAAGPRVNRASGMDGAVSQDAAAAGRYSSELLIYVDEKTEHAALVDAEAGVPVLVPTVVSRCGQARRTLACLGLVFSLIYYSFAQ